MEQGHWFMSLYNDDGDPQEISFTAGVADDMTHNCPNGCSGKGECLMGHCQCNPGFGGDDCSESKCNFHYIKLTNEKNVINKYNCANFTNQHDMMHQMLG